MSSIEEFRQRYKEVRTLIALIQESLVAVILGGDVTGPAAANTVQRINGATVPPAGALTTGNVLQVTGPSATGYAPVNLAGGANFVTGALPASNQMPQGMAGDVSGTTSANVVDRIKGATVPAAVTPGNVLQVSAANVDIYGPVNLAGGPNFVTGVLPTANQAPQNPTLAGDVTGPSNANTVARIRNNPVTAGAATGVGTQYTWDGAALTLEAGLGGAWIPNVLPAASPFTPSALQRLVPVDTTTAVVTVITPLSPYDGQWFLVKKIGGNNPITVKANLAGVASTIEDPNTPQSFGAQGTITAQGSSVAFKYRLSDSKWIAFIGV
jgi:hypothetical protein